MAFRQSICHSFSYQASRITSIEKMAEVIQVSYEQLEMHQDQETQGETQESTGN